MTLDVHVASSQAELEAAYQLRYDVHIGEMGVAAPSADHERRFLHEPFDSIGKVYVLCEGDTVVGTVRALCLADVPDPTTLIDTYDLYAAVNAMPASTIYQMGKLVMDPRVRKGGGLIDLLCLALRDALNAGVRLTFCDCSPHLISLYEMLGNRRYTRAYNDTIYGFKVPLMFLARDHKRLEETCSPLLSVVAEFPDDVELREWFNATFPAFAYPQSAPLMGTAQFVELLGARIAGDAGHRAELFRGLEQKEIEGFLARSTVVDAAPGDKIIKKGVRENTLFVMLEGLAYAIDSDRSEIPRGYLGAGDTFGEIALLTEMPRSADVVALEPCRLLVLTGDWFRKFIRDEPVTAAKVLLNLSRELAARLAAM